MYFVDGNNIIAAKLEADLGMQAAEAYLIQAISRWAEKNRQRVILAFDGRRHPLPGVSRRSSRLVDIKYPDDVPGATNADQVLLEIIRNTHGADGGVLITNDTELKHAAKALGIRRIISSEQFLELITDPDNEPNEQSVSERADPKTEEIVGETWEDYVRSAGIEKLKK